jgi:hypothetical protein
MGRPSGRGGRRGPVTGDGPVLGPLAPNLVDIVERLTTRFKGQTIPIRNPHDLADAIQRMDARIPKTAPPAGAPGAKAVRPPAPPATSKAVEPPELAAAEDPVTLLMQLRDQVVEQGDRIPNHTCVETIRRDVFAPTAGQANQSCDTLLGAAGQRPGAQRLKPDSTDRLRLDVAFSTAGREIYSWAGAGKFEDGELDELVQEGAMGSGPFAAMLLSAFQNRATKYVFEGETTVDGRRLYEYSFAVSQPQSRYKVKAQKDWIVTGYTGGIVLDAQTAALVRLTTRTEELPPETHTCETRTSLEYELVQLKGNDYLLPKVARQRFIGRDGYEAENTMTFSACRDFRAESKLAFGDDPPTTAPAPTTPAIDLPRGLPVSVELMTSIRFDDFAAGDAIDGRLAVPVRDARGNTLLPAGTPVQGRLMRLETDYLEHAEHTVVLRWETIEIAGARVPFSLMTKRQPPKATEIGREGNMLRKRLTGFELPRPGETRYGIYTFPGAATKVDSGFRTEWFTLKP